jgi:hypothetical protein
VPWWVASSTTALRPFAYTPEVRGRSGSLEP